MENLTEITLLMKCLTIICRHFDNIETICKSSYVSSSIAVCNHVIQRVSILAAASRCSACCWWPWFNNHKCEWRSTDWVLLFSPHLQILNNLGVPRADELNLIAATCNFLESIFDPFLTWRSFVRNNPADFTKLNYNVNQLHPEIVPFVYCKWRRLLLLILPLLLMSASAVIHYAFVADCFQSKNICSYPEIGVHLLNVLGAVVSGSQVSGATSQSFGLTN